MVFPSVRNSSAVEVAVPRSRGSAAFWAARSEGCITNPAPVPSRSTVAAAIGTGEERSRESSRAAATVISTDPVIGHAR